MLHNRLLITGLVALCAVPVTASADQTRQATLEQAGEPWAGWQPGTDSALRIISADRLRSLSQEFSALSCHITQEVAPQDSRERLQASSEAFVRALRALEPDSLAKQVTTEASSADGLAEIGAIKDLWIPIQEAIAVVAERPDDAMALSMVSAGSEVLHDLSTVLFAQVKAQYTAPVDVRTRDALLIDVAGQQSALIQQISGTACRIWAGDRSAKRMEEFSSYTWMLERGLLSLLNGMPSMGIAAAPTEDIRDALKVALYEWRSLKVFVIGMAENTVPPVAQRMLYERLYEENARLNDIVQLYTDYSRQLY